MDVNQLVMEGYTILKGTWMSRQRSKPLSANIVLGAPKEVHYIDL